MRSKLLTFFSVLLLVGSNDARPSKIGSPEIIDEKDAKSSSQGNVDAPSSSWRPTEPRSSLVVKTDTRTELKDLHQMNQSLRTVATQLLNVTNPNDEESKLSSKNNQITSSDKHPTNLLILRKPNDEKIIPNPTRSPSNGEKNDTEPSVAINSEIGSLGSMGVGFGRPVNSKFGFFESSHPGQAMALTEEELERELAAAASTSTRLMTAHKNHATTTGGISTWILLNPPTTTSKSGIDEETIDEKAGTDKPTTPAGKIAGTTSGNEIQSSSSLEKIVSQTTTPMERITTITRGTGSSLKKTTVHSTTTTEKSPGPMRTTLKIEKTRATPAPKVSVVTDPRLETTQQKVSVSTPKTTVTTKKAPDTNRTSPKPKATTPKPANSTSKPTPTKSSRPANQSTKSKPQPTRKITTKAPVETTKNPNTSKIEKVTFRPVHMITTPKTNEMQSNLEPPIFLAKIKASINTDPREKPLESSPKDSTSPGKKETPASELESSLPPAKAKKPNRTNVLKVQLKKPTESPTDIEIQPIRVNAPVLRIEKIETKDKASKKNSTKFDFPIPEDTRIDLKFDFNPNMTKIEPVTSTIADSTSTTTKRPHKRKKNKVRRRKPATSPATPTSTLQTASTPEVVYSSSVSASSEGQDPLTELGILDNTIQESKIVPESKITSGSSSNTKNKKKQVQKPIGTQIYNFLSREVMPSFGVMSLVGLGLGLASYFLYPFSGSIARRNYVVEPNYKYSMDEYGGNYGQNEEEVFSKVLQGMTNQDGKYGGIKDYENNFYRYQQSYEGSQHLDTNKRQPTKRVSDPTRHSTVSSAIYRPIETTIYNDDKYRNTEFKYPEVSTTMNYYERPMKPDFVGKKSGDGQFVVGNIPKEYGYASKANAMSATTENLATDHPDDYKFPIDPSANYGHAEALKSNNDYEEMEITPSAVQVEHGPRFIHAETMRLGRKKRESVIQLIPSRTELEKEERENETEEPLSNEILDIIDSVIPGENVDQDRKKVYAINGEKMAGETVDKKKFGDQSKSKESNSTKRLIDQTTTMNPGENDQTTLGTTETNVQDIEVVEKNNLPADKDPTTGPPEKTTENPSPTSTNPDSSESGSTTTTTTTTVPNLSIDEILGTTRQDIENYSDDSTNDWIDHTTVKPQEERFNIFSFVKKIAEVKLRLGVAILKHASEGFARYLGHVQKRINGEE